MRSLLGLPRNNSGTRILIRPQGTLVISGVAQTKQPLWTRSLRGALPSTYSCLTSHATLRPGPLTLHLCQPRWPLSAPMKRKKRITQVLQLVARNAFERFLIQLAPSRSTAVPWLSSNLLAQHGTCSEQSHTMSVRYAFGLGASVEAEIIPERFREFHLQCDPFAH